MIPDQRRTITGELVSVSRETSERLEIYAGLLTQWQSKINLVAHNRLRDTTQEAQDRRAELVVAFSQLGIGAVCRKQKLRQIISAD